MSTPLRTLLLFAILTIGASAFCQVNLVNFDFGAVPVECSSWGFAYEGPVLWCTNDPTTQNFNTTPGFGWSMGGVVGVPALPPGYHANGGAGLTGPYTLFYPPSFYGMPFNQAVFLQGGSFVVQSV